MTATDIIQTWMIVESDQQPVCYCCFFLQSWTMSIVFLLVVRAYFWNILQLTYPTSYIQNGGKHNSIVGIQRKTPGISIILAYFFYQEII